MTKTWANTSFMTLKTKKKITKSFVLFALALSVFLGTGWYVTPTFSQVRQMSLGSDRVLEDQNGDTIQMLRVDFNKRKMPWLNGSRFPEALKSMLLKSEDKRFYYHPGVDPIALTRALVRIVSGRSFQGASTLTMQVVDLIDPEVLSGHRLIRKGSLPSKLRQIYRALFLDLKWSKEEILETYLNEIHLKGEFQGFPAFSSAYFGKPPSGLSKEESALGVALISSPNQSRQRLRRRATALAKLENPESLDAPLSLLFDKRPFIPNGPNEALHLARRLFSANSDKIEFRATLDRSLQRKVGEILARHMTALKSKNLNDMAAIVVENSTGNVLSYVGNVSGYGQQSQVDGVVALRQAGSTLKPFIYAKALESRTLTTASILLDEPTAISWSGGVYRPANYDRLFNGPVSVREALASSLNVPAVKIVTMIGLYETYEIMKQLQFIKLQPPDFYGVSMALGAVDVQLESLANAYRMLANNGLWTPLRYLKDDPITPGKRIFSAETTYLIQSILSDPDARTIGFGWDSPLETPFWTAVKTGTSKNYHDNWCVGFSRQYTVAIWAGNFNAEAMNEVSGVSGAGPAWAEVMQHLHTALPSRAPETPKGVVQKSIQFPWSSSRRTEFFLKGTEPANTLVEPATEKRVQIVFPADGSVLVKNPHQVKERQALFVRFKGNVPPGSQLKWNESILGEAKSPFKIADPQRGLHQLSLISGENQKTLTKIRFQIK